MPRKIRKISSTGIYHVMIRGINKQIIFEDEEDRKTYMERLKFYREISGYTIYAYCLMGNHVHLLIRVGNEPLTTTMKRLDGSYVMYFNDKWRRTGALLQDPFMSVPVESERQFLVVLRYIHRNPVKGGLTEDMRRYSWSSIHEYLGTGRGVIDTSFDLQAAGGREALLDFHNLENDDLPEEEYLSLEESQPVTKLNDEQARKEILKLLGTNSLKSFDEFNQKQRNDYLISFYHMGMSRRQLARLCNVPYATVCYILEKSKKKKGNSD